MKKPNIICMGILNTKGEEIKFLSREVINSGGNVKIMDLSLGGECGWADIKLDETLKAAGFTKEVIFNTPRSEAALMVGKAGAVKIKELYEKGEVDGVISWAGAMGTTVATMIMRALPIGFPKLMMSTLASSDVRKWLVNKDIYIMNPIAEAGVNKITRMIVNTAASAIVCMARSRIRNVSFAPDNPLIAITAYGTTAGTVNKCAKFIKDKGWDTIIIHQTGSGATMEDLIREGQITAIYDITTAELSNTMFKSPYGINSDWDGTRLTAAGDMGIPQIVCPGGLDQFTLGPIETVPQSIMKDYKERKRVSYLNSGSPYIHNPNVTTLTPTLEETELLARYIVSKLNKTRGPTVLVLPMRGWSAYDQSAEFASIERGWPKDKGDGPVWLPDPDNPRWSARATKMKWVFGKEIDRQNNNLDLILCDMHILDDAFADLLNKCMSDMLDGKWLPGLYRDCKGIIP